MLGDTIRRAGEQSPELVNAPVAIWQGYGDEGWGHMPSIERTARRANIDPEAVGSFERDRLSPADYEEVRRFVYAANVLVESVGAHNANAAERVIFG